VTEGRCTGESRQLMRVRGRVHSGGMEQCLRLQSPRPRSRNPSWCREPMAHHAKSLSQPSEQFRARAGKVCSCCRFSSERRSNNSGGHRLGEPTGLREQGLCERQ
jgi:hypothetical protein